MQMDKILTLTTSSKTQRRSFNQRNTLRYVNKHISPSLTTKISPSTKSSEPMIDQYITKLSFFKISGRVTKNELNLVFSTRIQKKLKAYSPSEEIISGPTQKTKSLWHTLQPTRHLKFSYIKAFRHAFTSRCYALIPFLVLCSKPVVVKLFDHQACQPNTIVAAALPRRYVQAYGFRDCSNQFIQFLSLAQLLLLLTAFSNIMLFHCC